MIITETKPSMSGCLIGCLIASPLFYYCCRVALQSAAIRQIELLCYMYISSVLIILGIRVGSL